MEKKRFAAIVVIVAVLIVGGVWYRVSRTTLNDIRTGWSSPFSSPAMIIDADLVGGWKSIDNNSSFGNEIDFSTSTSGIGYEFRSYYYNPITQVTQPSILGTWRPINGGLLVIDSADISSTYSYPAIAVTSTTLTLFPQNGPTERYSKISPNP